MAPPPFLPEELISLILSNLDPREDAKTIHASRLANKMFNRLATPLLHRRIDVRMPTPGNYMKLEDAKKDHGIVQQLVENPHWTSFVKDLEISQSHQNILGDKDRERLFKLLSADTQELEEAVANAVKDERKYNARVAFFLLNCKDLQVLHSPMALSTIGRLVRRVFETAATGHLNFQLHPDPNAPRPLYLAHVREINMGKDAYYENPVADALTLLSLPSLIHLRIGNLADNAHHSEHNPPAYDGVVRNTNPLTLVFDMCMMSAPGLHTILETCPNTQSLTLRWRPGAWNTHFSNTAFCDLLRENATARRLEKLCLDCTPLIEHRSGNPFGAYGSFAGLGVNWLAVPKAFFDRLFDLPAEVRASEAAALLPGGLKELYVLGVEEGERGEREDMEKIVGLDVLREGGLGDLKKCVLVPWYHFILQEWFGEVHHRNVDYDAVPECGFEIGRMN